MAYAHAHEDASEAPGAQPAADPIAVLTIRGANGVAAPVSGDWETDAVRNLVSAQTIADLGDELGEPQPAGVAAHHEPAEPVEPAVEAG